MESARKRWWTRKTLVLPRPWWSRWRFVLRSHRVTALAVAVVSPIVISTMPAQAIDPIEAAYECALPHVEPVTIARGDAVLGGWLALPPLNAGERVPVLVSSSPYLGLASADAGVTSSPTPDQEAWWCENAAGRPTRDHWGVPPIKLIQNRYAVLHMAVRGTGPSTGCLDWGGAKEQADQTAIIEWAASQDWSDGRAAMGGRSWVAWTAQQAAVQRPEALKTIVITAAGTEFYMLGATPQGAPFTVTGSGAWYAGFSDDGGVQPFSSAFDPNALPAHADRTCSTSNVDLFRATTGGWASDDRYGEFWKERSLTNRLDEVKASVLIASGFRDDFPMQMQDTYLWRALRNAPKRAIHGYWGHDYPHDSGGHLRDHPSIVSWENLLFEWLDYWVKGLGEKPQTGIVDYEVAAGVPPAITNVDPAPAVEAQWKQTRSWPPSEVREEVLHLGGRKLLQTAADTLPRSFRSAPDPAGEHYLGEYAPTLVTSVGDELQTDLSEPGFNFWPALCGGPEGGPGGLAYLSDPLPSDVVIAGNPFAYFDLSADQRGGLVSAALISIEGGWTCTSSEAGGVHVLSLGAADLRFHRGGFMGSDFGPRERVRMDMFDLSELVPAGHRIGLVLSYGSGGIFSTAQPYTPMVTVYSTAKESSHVVLPIVSGSLGGKAPKGSYPPAPFSPVQGR